MTTNKNRQLALQVSRLYFLDQLSQTQIANQLQLSRPTISRLLQLAQTEGIVQIQINDPFTNRVDLEEELKSKFNLKDCRIVDQTAQDESQILEQMGQAGATYLQSILKDGDILGLTWGKTMAHLAKYLQPTTLQNLTAVYLKGTVANSSASNYSSEITKAVNRAFNTQTEILPVPVIFGHQQTRDLVSQDRFIHQLLDLGRQANIAVYTVGTTRPTAMLFQLGYFNQAQIDSLMDQSVGDLLSQFIDLDGQIVDPNLNQRTMALPLDELKQKDYSILVAGGTAKLAAIQGALKGGYPNVLVTDINMAKNLLDVKKGTAN